MGHFANAFHEWLELPIDAFPHMQKGLESIPLTAVLNDKDWTDVLLYLIPGWHISGTRISGLNWSESQPFEKDNSKSDNPKVQIQDKKGAKSQLKSPADYQDIIVNFLEKVPSSEQKGAKLLAKKSWYIISILVLASLPIRIEKLMEWMQYKKRQSFRELYLIPMQQCGLISKTNPTKRNAPDQQYIITEAGKAFLSGMFQQ
jgi:hypothetical protein